ncbi:MAG: hypothetical protein IH840_15575 [Candidatus Heimdallarchaeota archaeon]|nr:hypothetical protein [Candidatus Heimdallarchaeota archaeon]
MPLTLLLPLGILWIHILIEFEDKIIRHFPDNCQFHSDSTQFSPLEGDRWHYPAWRNQVRITRHPGEGLAHAPDH